MGYTIRKISASTVRGKDQKMKPQEFQDVEKLVRCVHISYALTDQTTYYKANATTPLERLALRVKVKEVFANVLNDSKLAKLETDYRKIKTKIEKQKKVQEEAEKQQWLQQYNDPFNRFLRLVKNNYHIIQPQFLEEWVQTTSIEERKQTLKQLKELSAKRGLPLSKDAIEFSLNFLQNSITELTPQKGKRKRWLNKIIKRS